jgi:hypothetical protein
MSGFSEGVNGFRIIIPGGRRACHHFLSRLAEWRRRWAREFVMMSQSYRPSLNTLEDRVQPGSMLSQGLDLSLVADEARADTPVVVECPET